METYCFEGALHEEVRGMDIEMPLNFSIVLNPESDEELLSQAANAVIYAICEKQSRLKNLDGKGN